MSFVLYLTNNIGPTRVGVNTFSTIVLLTLITNCNIGALLATQHTHFLILCLILRGSRVALVSPNVRRDMLPWSVVGLTDLPLLSSNEWHNDMNPAFISTIMAPNFEIKEITSGTRRSVPIPNQNIC